MSKSLIEITEEKLRRERTFELLNPKVLGMEVVSEGVSHHVVVYPDILKANPINPDKIFANGEDTSYGKKHVIAAYYHIPACTGRCGYCDYDSKSNPSSEFLDEVLLRLEQETSLFLETNIGRNSEVVAVYIGGGTPTCLSPKQLERLSTFIKQNLDLSNKFEFTVEASPETLLDGLGEERLDVLRRNGINRLSIGIQSFDDEALRYAGRRHNSSQAIESIEKAKKYFEHINVDLMPRLPYQPVGDWEENLRIISEEGISVITVYPLMLKPGTRFYTDFMKNPSIFPSARDGLVMHAMAKEKFCNEDGMYECPSFWFSKPGYPYKLQFQKWYGRVEESEDGYGTGEMVGFGVDAYSWLNDCQYQNYGIKSWKEYTKSLDEKRLPIERGEFLAKEELGRRHTIFGIRAGGIHIPTFESRYGYKPEQKFGKVMDKLHKLGLIRISSNRIDLTYNGTLFNEEVARSFII